MKTVNLWETLVVVVTHTRCKHAADGCMLSFIPLQICQADEKSAVLSNSGVSQLLKLTCRPTEHFSLEYKIVTKQGSAFCVDGGKLKATMDGYRDLKTPCCSV